MGDATEQDPPFDAIVVYKLRNFSWSLDETALWLGQAKGQRSQPPVHRRNFNVNYSLPPTKAPHFGYNPMNDGGRYSI